MYLLCDRQFFFFWPHRKFTWIYAQFRWLIPEKFSIPFQLLSCATEFSEDVVRSRVKLIRLYVESGIHTWKRETYYMLC